MAKFDLEGAQNVEVSQKLACEKTPEAQLDIMERYTRAHRESAGLPREAREVACLRAQFPAVLRRIEPEDLLAGRADVLPIGFGCVTSLGGVGHYCVFAKLRALEAALSPADRERAEALYRYWEREDLKTLFCREALTDATVGRFIDTEYPLIATARLSGMTLDYEKLVTRGLTGLRAEIESRLSASGDHGFLRACLDCLDLADVCAAHLSAEARADAQAAPPARRAALARMAESLEAIRVGPPRTFQEALQLFWLYALLAGVINYGRLDDALGPFLWRDLETGALTEEEAYALVRCLWRLIENKRTTVNGRVVVGGRGRRHPREADAFLRLALRACRELRYVEPQFTLRVDETTPEAVWDAALDALGAGATYPTLYNDAVNVPAVAFGMRVDAETAAQYVPFGCTEFVIQGQSTGTPNICMNLLKLLTIYMNRGVDPMDGMRKDAGVPIPRMEDVGSYEAFFAGYARLIDAYLDLAIDRQTRSFAFMNERVSFLFTSILTDDCLARGRAALDGGVRYLGGTNEIYGSINASDALYAVRRLVFEEKRWTLPQIARAVLDNFEGHAEIRRDCLRCAKYGNDDEACDGVANDLYEHVARGTRDRGIAAGMQYFLIVISNNQLNTDWGLRTGASPDGRLRGAYLNPANNPQGGANTHGPTAMLHSLGRFSPRYHAGSVQNLKLSRALFRNHRDAVKALMRGFFADGGCHLMVTAVDRGELEDAMVHPERHADLIVRVSGFSAVFVRLDRAVQEELLSRVLYDEETP